MTTTTDIQNGIKRLIARTTDAALRDILNGAGQYERQLLNAEPKYGPRLLSMAKHYGRAEAIRRHFAGNPSHAGVMAGFREAVDTLEAEQSRLDDAGQSTADVDAKLTSYYGDISRWETMALTQFMGRKGELSADDRLEIDYRAARS